MTNKDITEKTYLCKHPFDIWKSEEVTELLIDFYSANLVKAGLPKNLGRDYVLKVWNNKNSSDKEKLRSECDTIMTEAKNKIKYVPDEADPLDLFDLSNVDTFLDIGANKLSTINYYSKKYSKIKRFIGVDIIPQRNPFDDLSRGTYYQIDSDAKSFPIKNQSVDFINIQFALHHFLDLDSIQRILANCQKAIKPDGCLLLWEESFTDTYNMNCVKTNNDLGIKTDRNMTKRFYDLNEQQRYEFIIVNDWLINVNNPHMPWTGQYYNWNEWKTLLKKYGFVLEKQYNLGLRINGRLKQGVHMMGVFRSKS